MKKFNIIEEGRLSKSDMSELIGGVDVYFCVGLPISYTVTSCGKSQSLSTCPIYASCSSGSSYMGCVMYVGPAGPGGLSGTVTDDLTGIDFGGTQYMDMENRFLSVYNP
ncbi:MAG: hypothetical protein LBO74_15195 [Candidatus Symbiothrix sp.]|jgi:hypothetical protein|nr:hypothetical protein [Candidatus Symbiothrix sp.]